MFCSSLYHSVTANSLKIWVLLNFKFLNFYFKFWQLKFCFNFFQHFYRVQHKITQNNGKQEGKSSSLFSGAFLMWFAPPFLSILTCFSLAFFSRLYDVMWSIQTHQEKKTRRKKKIGEAWEENILYKWIYSYCFPSSHTFTNGRERKIAVQQEEKQQQKKRKKMKCRGNGSTTTACTEKQRKCEFQWTSSDRMDMSRVCAGICVCLRLYLFQDFFSLMVFDEFYIQPWLFPVSLNPWCHSWGTCSIFERHFFTEWIMFPGQNRKFLFCSFRWQQPWHHRPQGSVLFRLHVHAHTSIKSAQEFAQSCQGRLAWLSFICCYVHLRVCLSRAAQNQFVDI